VKRELMIKGNTPGEKFNSIEAILRRMSRRLSHKVVGVLPVSPVFEFAYVPDSDNIVMRRLFPVSGTITKAGVAFDSRGKKPIRLMFGVENDITMRTLSSSYLIKRKAEVLDINFEVESGDKITVKAELEEGEVVKGIWIGLSFEPGLKHMKKQEFLLSELELMTEEDNEGI